MSLEQIRSYGVSTRPKTAAVGWVSRPLLTLLTTEFRPGPKQRPSAGDQGTELIPLVMFRPGPKQRPSAELSMSQYSDFREVSTRPKTAAVGSWMNLGSPNNAGVSTRPKTAAVGSHATHPGARLRVSTRPKTAAVGRVEKADKKLVKKFRPGPKERPSAG